MAKPEIYEHTGSGRGPVRLANRLSATVLVALGVWAWSSGHAWAVLATEQPLGSAEEPTPPGTSTRAAGAGTVIAPVSAQGRKLLRSIRAAQGRAWSVKDKAQRAAGLRDFLQLIGRQVAANRNVPGMLLRLRDLQIDVLAELGDHAAVKQVIQVQQSESQANFSPADFEQWSDWVVYKLRNTRRFDCAVLHLRAMIQRGPDSTRSAERSLLIGDILMQKGYPDGPYDDAITQFAGVHSKYRQSYPDIADDARIRQAKGLWLNGKVTEAKQLFESIAATASLPIAEQARHLPDLMASMEAR